MHRSGWRSWASRCPRWPSRWRYTSRRFGPATSSTPPASCRCAEGELVHTGKVGAQVLPDDAKVAARQCAMNALAAVDALVGIDAVTELSKSSAS